MTTVWIWSGLWKITITPISGSPVTFQSSDGILSEIELVLNSEGMSTFRTAIINNGGAYNSLFVCGDTVDIWLDPSTGVLGTTKRLKGFIKKVQYKRAGVNNTLIISGFDYKDKFNRIVVNKLYSGVQTYDSVLVDLITSYAPEVSTTGLVPTGKSMVATDTLKFEYITLYEVLTRLFDLVGDWVWQITSALVFTAKERGGDDTTKQIEDFDNVTATYDDDKLVNKIYVLGGSDYSILSNSLWSGTASLNNADAPLAYNNVLSTGWDSGSAQADGDWYKLDLGALEIIGRIYFDNSSFLTKYPRNYRVEASKDNVAWELITQVLSNTSANILIDFPQEEYRYIKITLTGADTATWAIGEITIFSYYDLVSLSQDSGSQSEYGLYESVVRDSTLATKQLTKEFAAAQLKKYKDPICDISAINLSYFLDVSPNEKILINVPGTPVNQKFAVSRVQYSEETYGSFKENIDLRST